MWTALGDAIEPEWAPGRERAIRAAIARRATRHRRATRAVVAAGSMGLLAVGGWALLSPRAVAPGARPTVAKTTSATRAQPTQPAQPAADRSDVVRVTHLAADTVLVPLPDREGRGYSLRAGAARFAVPYDAHRPFVVTAGDVIIEDLGTTFTVRYLAADRLTVAVEEGRVRVRAGKIDAQIAGGGSLDVPVSVVAAAPPKSRRSVAMAASPWRPLAERGQYAEAQRALSTAGSSAVRNDTADLLLAADAARLSGHPAEAVPYLQRILRGHAQDPRAGLAAFTLGRVLLDELGRPGEAAEAFAAARSSAGPLAEDALAREVEALSRAGEVTRSRELALEYQRRYPNGRRAKAVAKFGGID